MCKNGTLPKKHYQQSLQLKAYTVNNVKELHFIRNRLGWNMAFLEDPVLNGLLAARGHRGLQNSLKKAALLEAQEQAKVVAEKGQVEEVARTLLGPRGGMPTLRRDLLQLAALLKVEINAKATNEEIKIACRPMVQALMAKPKSLPSPATSAASMAYRTPEQQRARASASPSPTEVSDAPSEASEMITQAQLKRMLDLQDEKFRGMLEQVSQYIMRSNPQMASSQAEWMSLEDGDLLMEAGTHGQSTPK